MGEVFPADDPVARWLVTMSVGLNDVVFANRLVVNAKKDYENLYFFRLASAHLWELAKLITESHAAWGEIQEFVKGLPEAARNHFESIQQIATTGDVATVGTELVQVRDLFAHYQEMDEQARKKPRDPIYRAIEGLADAEIELEVAEEVGDLRLEYADEVISKTVLRLIPDEDAQKRFLESLAEGIGHIAQFVQIALNTWIEPRKDKLEQIG